MYAKALRSSFKDKINAVPLDEETKKLMLAESINCFKMNNEVGVINHLHALRRTLTKSLYYLSIKSRLCAAWTAPARSSLAGYSSGSSCSCSSFWYAAFVTVLATIANMLCMRPIGVVVLCTLSSRLTQQIHSLDTTDVITLRQSGLCIQYMNAR